MSIARTASVALIALLLVSGCGPASSSEESEGFYELSGIVMDHEIDMPLAGANVELVGTGIGAATGPDGRYLIRTVPAGSYTLRIHYGGKLVRTEQIEIPGEHQEHVASRPSARPDPAAAPHAPKVKPSSPDEEVFVVVEQMPQLIGGLEALQREIQYPAIAAEAGIEGRVIIQFIVDEDGHPTNPVVVRGIGAGCDEEAIRAAMTTRFEPGRQRGKTVKVKMSLPVTFKLS